MTCVKCLSKMSPLKLTAMRGEFRGVSVDVNVQGHECPECGYKMVEGRHMGEFMVAVADAYRVLTGRLTAAEIRRARERLGMNQESFAEYLGVGIASLKRWESGDVQTKSVDELIRLKTDTTYAETLVADLYQLLATRPSSTQPQYVGGGEIGAADTALALAA